MIDWIGIPVSSAFLFVLGGLLAGYLLFYRDRSDDQRAVDEAERKYAKARASAVNRKRELLELEKQVEEHATKAEALRSDNQTLLAQREVWEGENSEVQAQMQRLIQDRDKGDQVRSDLDRKHREALARVEAMEQSLQAEQEAHRKTQQQAQQEFNKIVEAQADAEQQLRELQASAKAALTRAEDGETVARKFEDKNDELAIELQRAQEQVEQLEQQQSAETTEWSDRLKTSDARAEQLQAELQRQSDAMDRLRETFQQREILESDHENLAKNHSELQQDYDLIQTKLESELDSHAESREQLEELQQELKDSNERLLESDAQIQDLNRMLVSLRETVEDRTQKNLELESDQAALRDQAEEAERVLVEKDQLAESLKESQRLLDENRIQNQQILAEKDELAVALEEAQGKVDHAVTERDQTQQNLLAVNESVGELRSLLAERDSELMQQVEERANVLRSRDETIAELQANLEAKEAMIQDHGQQAEEWTAKEQELSDTKRMLGDRTESLQAKVSEFAALSARMDQQKQQVIRLQSESSEREDQVRRLERELEGALQFRTQAEDLGGQCRDLRQELADANQKIQLITQEHEASLDANASMEERVVSLETQLHAHTKTIRELRRHRVSLQANSDHSDASSQSTDGASKRAA